MARFRDSADRYGLVTRLLHWGMALLILWQFVGMTLRLLLGRTPVTAFFVGTHQSVGALLLALILLRLGWALLNRRNRPAHEGGMLGRAAQIGQSALYGLLVIVPLLAFVRSFGDGRGFAFFGWQIAPRTGERIAWMADPADLLHSKLAWLLLALIVGHAVMAVAHHVVWRDDTLRRMAGRVRRG